MLLRGWNWNLDGCKGGSSALLSGADFLAPGRDEGRQNDGTQILNGDHAEKSGSLRVGGKIFPPGHQRLWNRGWRGPLRGRRGSRSGRFREIATSDPRSVVWQADRTIHVELHHTHSEYSNAQTRLREGNDRRRGRDDGALDGSGCARECCARAESLGSEAVQAPLRVRCGAVLQ